MENNILNEIITIKINGIQKKVNKNTVLSNVIGGEKPCGGIGKCGKCKVFVSGMVSEPTATELELLSDEDLKQGIRLACLTYVVGECEIKTIGSNKKMQVLTDAEISQTNLNPLFKKYGVAIDIGTTTIVAKLYSNNGEFLGDAATLNPQREFGADIVSRINAALSGNAKELANLLRYAIFELISNLISNADVTISEIDGMVITGNTVMLSLLTEQSVEPFSHAPFNVKYLFGCTIKAKEMGLSLNASVYIPPCISAFVGADTACAILATNLCEKENKMLVDIGTNGEIALFNDGELTVCSTAAGPAFEGVGISCGMHGAVGAIDRVTLCDNEVKVHTIGEVEPIGICGSGLVDAVACLLEQGVINESGYIEKPFLIEKSIFITPKDIRMLQLAKSAIHAGLMTLVNCKRLSVTSISNFYIAGGFGKYLNIKNSVKIGLIPKALAEKSKVVGNAALSGASMILLDVEQKSKIENIVKKAKTLDLASNAIFSECFVSGMLFH